jgi:hypothetical protein
MYMDKIGLNPERCFKEAYVNFEIKIRLQKDSIIYKCVQ